MMTGWYLLNPVKRWLVPVGLTLIFATHSISAAGNPLARPALAEDARVVSLVVDGQTRIFTTDAGTVGEVLQRMKVTVGPQDVVEPGLDTPVQVGQTTVNIFNPRPVMVSDGHSNHVVSTALQDPRGIANAAGLNLYPEDLAVLQLETDFVDHKFVGPHVAITRALPVKVAVDGKLLDLRTQAKTVGGLLSEKDLSLGAKDSVTPALDAPLTAGMKIGIIRVSEVVLTKDEVLSRPVQTITDPDLPKGTSQVKSEGADGHRHVTYRIHYRNGVEVQRDTLNVEGLVNPQPRVVVNGSKVFFSGSIEYWRPLVETSAQVNGLDPNLMLAIMRCESNGNANASNGVAFGLFQYQMGTWLNDGGTRDNIYDGPTQIRITAGQIAANGTSPWNASKYCWANY